VVATHDRDPSHQPHQPYPPPPAHLPQPLNELPSADTSIRVYLKQRMVHCTPHVIPAVLQVLSTFVQCQRCSKVLADVKQPSPGTWLPL
jgi:hypothetical protein